MADPVQYRWKSVRFAVPAGFVDDSILRFRLGDAVSLTVVTDVCAGAIDAYARAQEASFAAQRYAGYRAEGPRVENNVVVVDRVFQDATGEITQRQAFVAGKKGEVVVVTGAARPAHRAQAQSAVAALVQSLTVAAT